MRQPSQILYLQRPLSQPVIVEIPWMEVYPPKPLRRGVPHIPGTKPFSRKLGWCDSTVEVTEVLYLESGVVHTARGAGCLSQTLNSTNLSSG